MSEASELRAEAAVYKREVLGAMLGPAAAADRPARIPARGNLLGVGYGAKVVGRGLDGLAVRVYVRTKRPRRQLTSRELVPDEVAGVPTDVIALGDLVARGRPVPCGVSVGHRDVTAGTLGCLVELADAPGRYILSNNHVLANSNDAAIGDPILEPGPADGGDKDDPIARLHAMVPLRFDDGNTVDAAVGELLDPSDVLPEIAEIGPPLTDPVDAVLYRSVRKHGRTTGHTVGVVLDIAADIQVRFGMRTVRFDDQFAVVGAGTPFSDGGDSGSLVVDAVSRAPVGLLFAGGGDTTFCNPIQAVLDGFDATVVGASTT
jgi:hypothetical protein